METESQTIWKEESLLAITLTLETSTTPQNGRETSNGTTQAKDSPEDLLEELET